MECERRYNLTVYGNHFRRVWDVDLKHDFAFVCSGLIESEFFVDENSQLKAIDFGLSNFVKPDKRLNDIVGSAYYVASEVLHRSYNTEADVWSIGVISYILLCGSCPFLARTESEIFRAFRADSMNLLGLLYLLKPRILSSVILGLVTTMIFKLMKAYMRSSSLHKAALRALSNLVVYFLLRMSERRDLLKLLTISPLLDKNVKVETPQKLGADGKKGGDVRQGTPYPKGGKTPASGGKSNKSLLGHSVQFTVENRNRPVFQVQLLYCRPVFQACKLEGQVHDNDLDYPFFITIIVTGLTVTKTVKKNNTCHHINAVTTV
ncbi:hypothetical protein C5167_023037 [Papaver somniferum]|uniref:Protein kinase domain-containing protein n=1 Tax=Papaver somniferum TaxID=3469 RepID=A0A4Y7JNG1_PAPSO|nr:hypothetical protein C5167_023037 [Papaver somniferum]